MATKAILVAAQSVIQTALTGEVPGVVVQRGSAQQLTNDVEVYLLHRGSRDERKSQGWLRRTHTVSIHLLVRMAGEADSVEDDMADANDLILAAFYGHHTLLGTCADCQIKQDEVGQPDGNFYLLIGEDVFYRSRWYALTVTEDFYPTEQA